MKKHLFTVFDSAAGLFLDPFVAPSIEFAIREFRRLVNTDGHQFNTYPADYTLFHVGTFDPQHGAISDVNLTSLGVAVTFVEQAALPFIPDSENDEN